VGLPANYNFYIYTGDTTTRQVQYLTAGVPVDLSGLTIEWEFVTDTVTIVANTANSMLSVVGVTGVITLTLPSTETDDLSGRGRHTLRITAPYVKTLLIGEVIASD